MLVECGRQELCSCVPFLITWHRVELISEEMVLLRVDMSILSRVEISSFVERCGKFRWKIDGGEIVDFVGSGKFVLFFLDQGLSMKLCLMY